MPHRCDERALRGRALRVRPPTTAETQRLQELDRRRRVAAEDYDRYVVHLYLVGVAQTGIAAALSTSAQNVGNLIRNRRRRWGTERLPVRRSVSV